MIKRKRKMEACMFVLLSFMLMTSAVFGQGTSSTLSGTVQDTSGGVMVGATITARNGETGVETRATTNNAGVYNLVLQPGIYTVIAEASGFQRTTRTDVRLIAGSQINLPLPMAVMGQVTEIEVTGTAESMTLEASASTGTIIQEDLIQAIPTLTANAIDATLSVMGGVTRLTSGGTQLSAAMNLEVAGVQSAMINVSRDGISVNESRYPTGIAASSNINPEVVGEMRIVQSAVDAELGRGAAQIQVTTRSGSNAYHGSVVWNVQNTALDAVDFSTKNRGLTANWRNVNNYTLTASGPIIRNKSFFFASWEQQIARDKMIQIPRVMTSCARRGIYRWLTSADAQGGWLPATINVTDSYALDTGNMRSVNEDGTPWGGGTVSNTAGGGSRTVGPTTVMFESIFGHLQPDVRNALSDRNNPLGVYGDGEKGCTMMDTLGYDPMNNKFLTTTDGTNTNGWTGDFSSGGAYRYAYDPTGFAHRFLYGADYSAGRVEMPPANYYRGQGDGLNSAGYKWTTLMVGQGSSNYGTGGDPDRKSITTRIDHNINNDHRLSGSFDYENFYVWDAYRTWPEEYGSYNGDIVRKPWSLRFTLNSTLKPTLLNEFRFGYTRASAWAVSALGSAKNKDNMESVLKALSGNDASNPYYAGSWSQDQILIIGLGDGDGGVVGTTNAQNATAYRPDMNPNMAATDNIDRSHPYGTRGNLNGYFGGHDPRWSLADTVTWIKGTHSFRGGFEYRRQSSYQANYNTMPLLYARGGGYTNISTVRGGANSPTIDRRRQSLSDNGFGVVNGVNYLYAGSQDTSRSTNGNYVMPYNMMTYFSGSLGDTSLYYYAVPDPSAPTGARWNDLSKGEDMYEYTLSNQEFSWFFKDDWKLTSNLTLNLGVRWEYYGVPHASDGLTIKVAGDSKSAWGISPVGDFFNNGKGWVVDRQYLPGFQRDAAGNPILPDPVIQYEYVGPESPNPNRMIWNRDMNNFAPHVGFAWSLPWFGAGMTTLRGGYSISYGQIDNFDNFPTQFVTVDAAGVSYTNTFTGDGDNLDPSSTSYYMDLTDLKTLLPLKPQGNIIPLGVKLNDALYSSTVYVFDEDIRNPFVHSLNASLTRSIGRMFTVDLRYVGTFRRKPIGNLGVNQNNFLDTTLFDWIKELDTIRTGGDSMYVNSIIPQNTQALGQQYYSTVWGQTGSDQIRQQQAANVARGGYSNIVSGLGAANGQLPTPFGSERGLLLRSGCLPGDRPGYAAAFAANNRVDVNDYPCTVGTPLNFYYASTQFSTTNIRQNIDDNHVNYNSMQAQVSMRPTRGLSFQTTWTWSRNLSSASWSNYLEGRDYNLSGQHRSHTLRAFGTYELPFGPQGFFLRDSTGWVRKTVQGWQASWVIGLESGPPISVAGNSTLYGRSWPIIVRPDLWDNKQGKIRLEWGPNGEFQNGTYLARDYIKVLDANICNPDRMTADLYREQCVNDSGVVNTSAPRALALGTRDSNGTLVPALYDRDTLGDDGVMYKAGTPIIVFRNADQTDGRNATGNYKPTSMTAQGRFSFDMAISKSVEFMEGKRFEIRVDAQNILNHPTGIGRTAPQIMESGGKYVSIDSPSIDVNSATAPGLIQNKVGHRTFQARLAFRF